MTSQASTEGAPPPYVDIYLLPVPEANLDAYRDLAERFGRVAREHGALSYREFRGDDLGDAFGAMPGEGEVLTAAVVEFTSRAHRDEVMAKVMADERVAAMGEGDQLTDMDKMRYGGFATFVEA